jgi:hypothetical protein
MSLSTLFILAAMYFTYRLGVYNTRKPGQLASAMHRVWVRGCRWFNQGSNE